MPKTIWTEGSKKRWKGEDCIDWVDGNRFFYSEKNDTGRFGDSSWKMSIVRYRLNASVCTNCRQMKIIKSLQWYRKDQKRIMRSIFWKTGMDLKNYPSNRLIKFCQENDITVINIWFKLPKTRIYCEGKIATKTYPGCNINIDHNPIATIRRMKFERILNLKPRN